MFWRLMKIVFCGQTTVPKITLSRAVYIYIVSEVKKMYDQRASVFCHLSRSKFNFKIELDIRKGSTSDDIRFAAESKWFNPKDQTMRAM